LRNWDISALPGLFCPDLSTLLLFIFYPYFYPFPACADNCPAYLKKNISVQQRRFVLYKINLALFFKIFGLWWGAVTLPLFAISLFILLLRIMTFGWIVIRIKTVFFWGFLTIPAFISFGMMNWLIWISGHCEKCGAELKKLKIPIAFSPKTGKPTRYDIKFRCSKSEKEHPAASIEMESFLLLRVAVKDK